MIKKSEDVIDYFDGMLTKDQADRIYSELLAGSERDNTAVDAEYVCGLLISGSKGALSGLNKEGIRIKDKVYRVFNVTKGNFGAKATFSRIIVLGTEGATVNVLLSAKASEAIDSLTVERGDTVLLYPTTLDVSKSSLKATQKTKIEITARGHSGIKDFSDLPQNARNIDVVGRIIESGPKAAQVSQRHHVIVLPLTLSDGKNSVNVVCEGLSAEAIEKLPLNSLIKIEFCRVAESSGVKVIYADSLSRIIRIRPGSG